MPDAAKKAAASKKPVTKRKVLTSAERIAKAEQDLADLKAKAEGKNAAKVVKLNERKAKLAAQVFKANTEISEINGEIAGLGGTVVDPDPIVEAVEEAAAAAVTGTD